MRQFVGVSYHDQFGTPTRTFPLFMAGTSSARDQVEDTYEAQNDQRLDELHSKIRTLRGVSLRVQSRLCKPRSIIPFDKVTTDIHDDVERQNLMLDDTVRFLSLSSLTSGVT
jgi:hypothetical protein